MHMISTVDEARRAAEAGADVIVAQGTEGGGHVWLMGTMVLVPQVVRAVAPLPVLAAGGIADGAGLAAALILSRNLIGDVLAADTPGATPGIGTVAPQLALVVAIVAGLLAAILPARRASRLNILTALQYE
jgi:hypothetical protein